MGIVPLKNLDARPPEAGRLRFGDKVPTRNGKLMPKAVDKWRFTSPDLAAIKALAEIYGGEVSKWDEPKASPRYQWQLRSEANAINVWLPTGSLTMNYELWGGAGIERRCDGETCTGHTAIGRVECPCVCIAEGLPKRPDGRGGFLDPACKPHSRVSMILPDIPFGGVWRLEVKGEIFRDEAPGMIGLVEQLQASRGMTRVRLALTARSSVVNGQMAHYIVPQFYVDETPEQMLAGASVVRVGLPGVHEAPALPAAPTAPEHDWGALDDDVIEAQVIEFPRPVEPEGWDRPPGHVPVRRNPDPNGPAYIRK